jgi:hypothetical protein
MVRYETCDSRGFRLKANFPSGLCHRLARHAICRLFAMRPTLFLPVLQALQEDLEKVQHPRTLKKTLDEVMESTWERVKPVSF